MRVFNTTLEAEHFHQDIELLYIIEGSMDIHEGENSYHMKKEDILVINANKRHSFKASEDILFVKLMINYELVSDVFKSDDIMFWCNSTKDESQRFGGLRKALKQLLRHYLNNHGETADFGHIALCYEIMNTLSVNFLISTCDKEQMSEKDKYEHRILQINNYIRAHYDQPISLKELADKLYLSNGYLSRFFKKNYGMSFADYLSNVRLFHAVDELLYTKTPITRIAGDNGFASVAVFNKVFKKTYGETPSELRKKAKQAKTEKTVSEDSMEVERRLEQLLREEGAEPEETAVAGVIEAEHLVTKQQQLPQTWNKTINAGAAEDLLRSEVREHIILLKESLKFEYVRFWNIFSEALFIDIDSEEYNFSRLDSILDFLVQQRIKPHIELGQKPKRIQRNVQSALIYQDKVAEFKDIFHWDKVIDALMSHLQNRYGRKEIDTWRIELWHVEQNWREETGYQQYYEQFSHTYDIVRKYSSDLEVGGCGFRSNNGITSNRKFAEGWRKSKRLPDFVSIIIYSYVQGKEDADIFSKRSTDASYALGTVRQMRTILREEGLTTQKLYVTEWNLTISDRNFINDTCYKGAYVVRNVLELAKEVDDLAYFPGSDRISEYYDSNMLLHGGMGLLAKDSVFKPAGFAFEFLNRLYPYAVGQGDNYVITTDGHQAYGIVCHNYKNLNYTYYLTSEDQIEKESIWKYFEDRDGLELKLKLVGLAAGTYQMKTYRINERSGSILNIWQEMNFARELSREDIKYFRRICEPRLTIDRFEVETSAHELLLQLSANEIMYVRIRKIK